MSMKMGEKIKILRKRKGISQEALAQMLGVSFQAVSKWETGATMPDIALIPAIAAFFDVSTDELFDYNVLENERKVDEICRTAAPIRVTDPIRAEALLRDGLRQFPGNEKLLTVLLYTLITQDGRENDVIDVCNILIECAQCEGIRYDVFNILARTYAAVGKQELVEPTLDRIPEFYFTKTECRAKLLTGEKSLEAAQFQMNLSAKCTIEMLTIMAKRYTEQNDWGSADLCRRIAAGILDVFRREDGLKLELLGYEWIEAMQSEIT